MCKDGWSESQKLVQIDMPGTGAEQVPSPHHLVYPHQSIVHDNGELVGEDTVTAPDEEVATVTLQNLRLRTIDDICERNCPEWLICTRNDDSCGRRALSASRGYFCGREVCTEDWLHSVVDYDIIPMLSEYWFDDSSKLQRWENILQGVFQ